MLGLPMPIPANSSSPRVQGEQMPPEVGGVASGTTPPERPTGGGPKAVLPALEDGAHCAASSSAARGGRAINLQPGIPPCGLITPRGTLPPGMVARHRWDQIAPYSCLSVLDSR